MLILRTPVPQGGWQLGTGTESFAAALPQLWLCPCSPCPTDVPESQAPTSGEFLISEYPVRGLGHHEAQSDSWRRKVVSMLSSPGWAKEGHKHKYSVKTKPNPPAKSSSLQPSSVWRQKHPGRRADKGRWWDMKTVEWDQNDWTNPQLPVMAWITAGKNSGHDHAHNSLEEGKKMPESAWGAKKHSSSSPGTSWE